MSNGKNKLKDFVFLGEFFQTIQDAPVKFLIYGSLDSEKWAYTTSKYAAPYIYAWKGMSYLNSVGFYDWFLEKVKPILVRYFEDPSISPNSR